MSQPQLELLAPVCPHCAAAEEPHREQGTWVHTCKKFGMKIYQRRGIYEFHLRDLPNMADATKIETGPRTAKRHLRLVG